MQWSMLYGGNGGPSQLDGGYTQAKSKNNSRARARQIWDPTRKLLFCTTKVEIISPSLSIDNLQMYSKRVFTKIWKTGTEHQISIFSFCRNWASRRRVMCWSCWRSMRPKQKVFETFFDILQTCKTQRQLLLWSSFLWKKYSIFQEVRASSPSSSSRGSPCLQGSSQRRYPPHSARYLWSSDFVRVRWWNHWRWCYLRTGIACGVFFGVVMQPAHE